MIIFLVLIALIIVLSHVFYLAGSSVTFEQAAVSEQVEPSGEELVGDEAYQSPDPEVEQVTVEAQSLLSADGIRFLFTSPVANFNGFGVVGLIMVAMIGVGLAEEVGLIAAFIKRLVKVTPRRFITFSIVLLGVLSSIATDAGYLVLIPLAAAVFHSLGRHPLAGLAAAFAGVGGGFGVNLLITPVDGMLAEITNEAIADPAQHVSITGNLYFSIVSTLVVAVVATILTEKFVEPRLGPYREDEELPDGVPAEAAGVPVGAEPEGDARAGGGGGAVTTEASGGGAASGELTAAERRGLRFAFWGLLGVTALVLLLTVPSWGPLRNPETGSLIEDSPPGRGGHAARARHVARGRGALARRRRPRRGPPRARAAPDRRARPDGAPRTRRPRRDGRAARLGPGAARGGGPARCDGDGADRGRVRAAGLPRRLVADGRARRRGGRGVVPHAPRHPRPT